MGQLIPFIDLLIIYLYLVSVSKMMGSFKKQELPAKRVSDTEDLLKDIKTSFSVT